MMSSLNRLLLLAVLFLLLGCFLPLICSAHSDDPMHPGSEYDGSKIAIANLNVEYGARRYGFFSVFDRRKPYVLFRVFNGVQMLSDNGTCYPSFPIMPYAVTESEVFYIEASVQDNYIALVNAATWVCTKNLINSEWNNGIAFDFKDECRESQIGSALFFSLSVSRHAIYFLNAEGMLALVSLREPLCIFTLFKPEHTKEYTKGLVNALHVTNYNSTDDDVVMLSVNSTDQVRVFNMIGAKVYTHNVTAGDKVVAIKSNNRMNIFLAVNRLKGGDTSAVVLMYPKGLKSDPVELFSLDHSLMVDFSATAHVTAILMRDLSTAGGGGGTGNGSTPALSTNFTVVFRPINQSPDKEVWYRCLNATDLKGLVLVDNREPQVVKDVCTDKAEICQQNTDPKCPGNSVLKFKILSPLVDHKSVDREAKNKLYMMVTLALLSLLAMVLLQFIPLA